MIGYVGQRARRKKRNFIFFLILIILLFFFVYLNPLIKLNETLPENSLLPTQEEIDSPKFDITIEELKLQVLNKSQKIIFRNKEIEKLRKKLKISLAENNKLLKLNLDLNNQDLDKNGMKKKLKGLNDLIINYKKIEKKMFNEITNLKNENNSIIKKYKKSDTINSNLNILQENHKKKIIELQNILEERNLIIKQLNDKSHHG